MQAFLAKMGSMILEWLFMKAWRAISNFISQKKAEKVNHENREDYDHSVQTGDLDAIAKAGESLLNSNKPK